MNKIEEVDYFIFSNSHHSLPLLSEVNQSRPLFKQWNEKAQVIHAGEVEERARTESVHGQDKSSSSKNMGPSHVGNLLSGFLKNCYKGSWHFIDNSFPPYLSIK